MKKRIAIIGSGIAGLTLGNLLLTNSEFEFVIYEKNNILDLNEGFGIQLSVNSIYVLNKIITALFIIVWSSLEIVINIFTILVTEKEVLLIIRRHGNMSSS